MSFASPLWLLVLVLVPLVLVAQWRWRGRARRYAVRFTAVASLVEAAAAPGAGRRRGYLPLVALLLAVALLALALARPRITHRVPIGDASLMLVLDHSGSMAATDVAPTRIQAAITAGNTLIDQLPPSARVGLVAFGSSPTAEQAPTADHAVTRQLLDAQQPGGGTDTGPALLLALQALDGARRTHPPSAIVLLSDGAANLGENPVTVAALAKREKIPIYTVALGTDAGVLNEGFPYGVISVPPDPQLMDQIAQTSGGRAFDAQTENELSSIYTSLGTKLSSVRRERDITVWVLLGAALALLLAAAGWVRSGARLP